MLTVGGAVTNGPEQMLRGCGEHIPKKTAVLAQHLEELDWDDLH